MHMPADSMVVRFLLSHLNDLFSFISFCLFIDRFTKLTLKKTLLDCDVDYDRTPKDEIKKEGRETMKSG